MIDCTNKVNKVKYNSIIGLTIVDALELNPDKKIRSVIIDGIPLHVTMDIIKDRINVEIRDGRIIRVVNIG